MARVFEKMAADCQMLKATAGADIVAGAYGALGSAHTFSLVDVANGDDYAAVVKCENVKVAKATGVTFAVGAPVYYDVADGNVNADGANVLIGFAKEAGASADTELYINFDGTLTFAKA